MTQNDELDTGVQRGKPEYRWSPGTFGGGRPLPRGPIGTHKIGPTAAIGFCPLCGTNSRQTTGVRGVFQCPDCLRVWYDDRVGEQPITYDEFFSKS